MANEFVQFARTTSAIFNEIASKDANTIYFLTDTNEIYLGSTQYSGNISELTKVIESNTEQVILAKTIDSAETVVVPTKDYVDALVNGIDTLVADVHSLVEDKVTYTFAINYDGVPQTASVQVLQNFPGETVTLTVPDEYPGTVIQWTKYYDDNSTAEEVISSATSRTLEVAITEQVVNYTVYVDSTGGSV